MYVLIGKTCNTVLMNYNRFFSEDILHVVVLYYYRCKEMEAIFSGVAAVVMTGGKASKAYISIQGVL